MKERICSEEEEEEEEEVEEEKEEVTNALVPNASYDVAPHTHQPKRPPPKIKEIVFPIFAIGNQDIIEMVDLQPR